MSGKTYIIPAHNGEKTEITDVYIRAVCRCQARELHLAGAVDGKSGADRLGRDVGGDPRQL